MIEKIKTAFFLLIPYVSLSNIAIMFVFKSQVHLLVMNLKKKQTEMATTISPVSVEVDTRPLSVYDAFLRGESS
ncbi:putative transposase for insertion sequence element domain protein [Geobacillus kaustophilus]|uniref:Putative transposase for insertion sequence element domain protein n=1 Tax=Geobacillus kaustophilus TaxID=1462 RepID=A0A0D8BZS3_GEOKU|nr:putative transposase for insertion sequence element domain protein [Geobacillus kaustophilus]